MTAPEAEFYLHKLCKSGNLLEIDQYLDDLGNQTINQFDKFGLAPIHYAVKRETLDIDSVIEVLVSRDVDVNSRTLNEGDTPLHIVVETFEEEYATMLALKLVCCGADLHYRNDKFRSPYDIAMARNFFKLVEMLSSDIDSEEAEETLEDYRKSYFGTKLIKAVLEGNREFVEKCVLQGADPDMLNEHGGGAIHYAITHCSANNRQILQLIIESDADINLQDYEGDTALNLVIKTSSKRTETENSTLARLLLEAGADVDIKDADGKSSRDLAAEHQLDSIDHMINSTFSNRRGPSDNPVDVNENPVTATTDSEDEDYRSPPRHSQDKDDATGKKDSQCVIL